ncbi:hypothetical protein LOOC260_117570 [Paucilactobacillus hokkaidonensis JCM 18461]|uniref:Uncharacterized protein n=1 Tax=Paucilactobacillus hokkaidonensis JCM 18461 TaxID=1291742 RepID=A0A0A1GZ32_9LACO|nr:hypothetical protein LOOC260_117570 [Paucilactobacillus hokkaidonensis JCM 18461]
MTNTNFSCNNSTNASENRTDILNFMVLSIETNLNVTEMCSFNQLTIAIAAYLCSQEFERRLAFLT